MLPASDAAAAARDDVDDDVIVLGIPSSADASYGHLQQMTDEEQSVVEHAISRRRI